MVGICSDGSVKKNWGHGHVAAKRFPQGSRLCPRIFSQALTVQFARRAAPIGAHAFPLSCRTRSRWVGWGRGWRSGWVRGTARFRLCTKQRSCRVFFLRAVSLAKFAALSLQGCKRSRYSWRLCTDLPWIRSAGRCIRRGIRDGSRSGRTGLCPLGFGSRGIRRRWCAARSCFSESIGLSRGSGPTIPAADLPPL